jgi:hypothetical protein
LSKRVGSRQEISSVSVTLSSADFGSTTFCFANRFTEEVDKPRKVSLRSAPEPHEPVEFKNFGSLKGRHLLTSQQEKETPTMKKLLTLTLALVALAAFPGLSAAQEKKTAEKPKAVEAKRSGPPANRLTLTLDPIQSLKACRVIARPSLAGNSAWKYPNQDVFFVKKSGPGNPPAPGKTDATGVLRRSVTKGQGVQAVLGTGPNNPVKSNVFVCPAISSPDPTSPQ